MTYLSAASPRIQRSITPLLVFLLLAIAEDAGSEPQKASARSYDARVEHNLGFVATRNPATDAALEDLRIGTPDLGVTRHEALGVIRSLYNRTGYLSEAAEGEPSDIAWAYVHRRLAALGLTAADLMEVEVTDSVFSEVSGATRIYWRQLYRGFPVYTAQLQVNVNRDGRVLGVNNSFVPGLQTTPFRSLTPSLGPASAVAAAARHLGLPSPSSPGSSDSLEGREADDPTIWLEGGELSSQPIPARLLWLPIRAGEVRLVWLLEISTLDGQHLYEMTVDAETGKIWTRFDRTNDHSYRVYERPVESPIHTTPLPPADARTLAVDPEDATFSPVGWFPGSGILAGNNVHACLDVDANNACDPAQPTCTAGVCDFPLDFTQPPATWAAAALTNIFYWTNTVHDIQAHYGFDEAAGNFQEVNFGGGGLGSDSVQVEIRDGSGNCNATFSTPPDGSNPRMQMFTCNLTHPVRDGAFDNGLVVHEYGHGISTRQVGGPSNSSCLNNLQQAGEGWSDFFTLVYTAETGDEGADPRGIGSYIFGLPAEGGTIRDLPYSTDPTINNWTYESITGAAVPHGVGPRWAQALWEVYWALVDIYGFEEDLESFDPGDPLEAGNQRALFYVNEGLKNTACSPTFLDNRDAVIQASIDNFEGRDTCRIWRAFAGFGLGTDAVATGPNSLVVANGFAVPPKCERKSFNECLEEFEASIDSCKVFADPELKKQCRTIAIRQFQTCIYLLLTPVQDREICKRNLEEQVTECFDRFPTDLLARTECIEGAAEVWKDCIAACD